MCKALLLRVDVNRERGGGGRRRRRVGGVQ